ncbi:hypothetical protein [Anaerovibrio sp. RM50]|uniref:hypothetical protein n=1 Tax=Anaerovibrio sp. RM50 TaxID=1200557 RepID=UPI000566F6E9|nr:hypothetical protein [Anaerovibrio sp. RM50]
MSYIVTKLLTTEDSTDFFLIGSFSDMKQAAAAATDEYKEYNKQASFMNLEMINEWLSTRGEYSFRKDKNNRIQLDISIAEENQIIQKDHQRIFTCTDADKEFVKLSSALVSDGEKKAEI